MTCECARCIGRGLSAVAVRMEPCGRWWSGGTENPVTASTGSFFFFFFWCTGSWLPPALFSSCGGRGSSLAAVCGPLPAELLLFPSTSSPACGLQHLRQVGSVMTALGSRSQAQQSDSTGLVAPRHVGFFRIRAPAHVSCTGRRTPYHWPTKEAPSAHCKTTSHSPYAPF